MELKNAAAVCLISLFSATLVVLIARSLDSQAASRIEPQLADIVAELRALRGQGGLTTTADVAAGPETLDNGLVVYYLHSNFRCVTCRSIESQTREVVQSDFAEQLSRGQVAWEVLNYEEPEGAELAKRFGVHTATIVLAAKRDGEIENWERLDQAPAIVGDKTAFASYVRTAIRDMLPEPPSEAPDAPAPPSTSAAAPDSSAPLPDTDTPADIPLP